MAQNPKPSRWIIYDPFVSSGDSHVVSTHESEREAREHLAELLAEDNDAYSGCVVEWDRRLNCSKMTPLELLEIAYGGAPGDDPYDHGISDGQEEAHDRLHAFLSRPEVAALSDPALGKAAASVIAALPGLLEMEANLPEGAWKATPHFIQPSDAWDVVVPVDPPATGRTLAFTERTARFIVATRNALHEAAHAASEAAKLKGDGHE